MQKDRRLKNLVRLLVFGFTGWMAIPLAFANSCTTQSQMSDALRQQLFSTAISIASDIQSGNIQSLQGVLAPVVAADFNSIAASATQLEPQIQGAAITVDTLLEFDATTAGYAQDQFFCSPPNSDKTIVLTLQSLPVGKYALALLHATGVKNPQQLALILAMNSNGQWQLAGFFTKPLTLNGQSGIWYWSQARQFAVQKGSWAAWFYYQIAQSLCTPVNFLSSPNLEQLKMEASQAQPQNLPGASPITITANGNSFTVTSVSFTTQLGPLDFAVTYSPSPAQNAALQNPVQARQQVIELASAILRMHPALRKAFHGVWVQANSGNATIYALELPMDQIPEGT